MEITDFINRELNKHKQNFANTQIIKIITKNKDPFNYILPKYVQVHVTLLSNNYEWVYKLLLFHFIATWRGYITNILAP